MTPTAKLRFVKRKVVMDIMTVEKDGIARQAQVTKKLLQQWWAKTGHYESRRGEGEWRDVPVEEEK